MVYSPRVAYFSMEVGLESGMPTSGGLGVLAGDTIRSAVDLVRMRRDPSTGLGCPEPVEGRIACFPRNVQCSIPGRGSRSAVRSAHSCAQPLPLAEGCLKSSLLLFSCQMADDFLGTGFLRVFNRGVDGTLILDGPSERHDSIPSCDVNEIAVDIRT